MITSGGALPTMIFERRVLLWLSIKNRVSTADTFCHGTHSSARTAAAEALSFTVVPHAFVKLKRKNPIAPDAADPFTSSVPNAWKKRSYRKAANIAVKA